MRSANSYILLHIQWYGAGHVTLGATSSLTVHIGGVDSQGSLNSTTQTTVTGNLTVIFDPGFTPAAGMQWPIVSGPPTGQFTQVAVRGLSSGLALSLEYTPNFVFAKLSGQDGINFADWAGEPEFNIWPT